MLKVIALGLFGLLFSAGAAIAGAAYKDVLDTPALASGKASRSALNGVAAAGAAALVTVGRRGHVLVSHNGGKDWLQSVVPLSSDLVAVHFPSAAQGWAVGHDGVVLHSADGGRSWIRQLDGRAVAALMVRRAEALVDGGGEAAARALAEARRFLKEGPGRPFLDVWFEDEQVGYVVGVFNMILRTGDGGKTWESWGERVDNPDGLHLNAIHAIGGELYIAGERGLLLRFDPAQKRFVRLDTPYAGSYFGVAGKPGMLVAFGLRGSAFTSRDRGQSWAPLVTNVSTGLTGGAVLGDGRLVLVSQGGQMLVSDDDGRTCAPVPPAQPMPLYGVAPLGANAVALVGARGVFIQTIK